MRPIGTAFRRSSRDTADGDARIRLATACMSCPFASQCAMSSRSLIVSLRPGTTASQNPAQTLKG